MRRFHRFQLRITNDISANISPGEKRKEIYICKMKKKWIFAFGFLVIMSCTPPRSIEYKTYHNFSIKSLGFNKTTVSLDLEYYNPNNFGMQLKNTDLDVFINGNLLGHSVSDSLIQIPRRGTFIIPVKFDVDMKNILKNSYSALTGKEMNVRLTGKIKAGKGNVFISFPVNYEFKETYNLF